MFKSWWQRWRTQSRTPLVRRPVVGRHKVRLELEDLEQRLAPATLSVDATHTFLTQLAAANPGDTVQIEPTGTMGNLQQSVAILLSSAAVGDTAIQVDLSFAPGQVITITSGAAAENELVDAVSGSGLDFTLTLHAPLQLNHPNGNVTPVANTLGIGKAVAIQGDPGPPPPPPR
jgi:hypothetical protein